jgi:hypothetical protein
MFKIKLCKTKAAYSIKPDKRLKLDLDKIKNKFKVIVDTPLLLVIDKDGEIIIHKHGELVFKQLKDEAKIKKIAQYIYKQIQL